MQEKNYTTLMFADILYDHKATIFFYWLVSLLADQANNARLSYKKK